MKLNISCPATGLQKLIEIDDPKQLAAFFEKRIAQEVNGEVLGDAYTGYVFRITGGSDKQGFPMKQGVITQQRVRLLMKGNTTCYHPQRKGERKRKSVRGCVVSPEIAVLNLAIVKKGDEDLPGLTDSVLPRRLGPKRATKIRKLFALDKEDDVRRYVIRRVQQAKEEGGKAPRTKGPKIQRLITPRRLQRKRREVALKKTRAAKAKADAAEYNALLKRRLNEQRSKRSTLLSKKRTERLSALPAAAADAVMTSAAKATAAAVKTAKGGKAGKAAVKAAPAAAAAKSASGKKAPAAAAAGKTTAAKAATSTSTTSKAKAAGKKAGGKKNKQ